MIRGTCPPQRGFASYQPYLGAQFAAPGVQSHSQVDLQQIEPLAPTFQSLTAPGWLQQMAKYLIN